MIDVHATHISRFEHKLTSPTIDAAKRLPMLWKFLQMSLYGSDEQIVNNKLNDEELLLLFHKAQQPKEEEITSVKVMLKAFVFQKNFQKQLA